MVLEPPPIGHDPKADKELYLKRLRRVEGQVRGLQRMVVEDAYCVEVMTQVSAATKALHAVALWLLEQHLLQCARSADRTGEVDTEGQVKAAATAIARLIRV
jgi:CsoR family transcriptional regulator, copper-sensing transcriptional repressor